MLVPGGDYVVVADAAVDGGLVVTGAPTEIAGAHLGAN